MTRRPAVVAFDVIDTLMSLEPLRGRLAEIGQPAYLLEHWRWSRRTTGTATGPSGPG